jgi:hypothetical protein
MSGQGRIVVTAAALVAAIAAFWFMVLAPKRADVAKVNDAVTQAEARRATAESAATAAQRTRSAYQRDYATLARLGKATPADDDVASLVFQLEALARANKVDFRAVKLTGTSAAATPAPAAPAAPPAASSDPSAKGSAGAGASDTAVSTATPAAPAITQAPPGSVVGSAGLLTLPFTFTFDGGYMPMQRMLGAIDRLARRTDGAISVRGRLVTVDGFALAASRFGFPKVEATVSATAYIVPADEGIMGGATPQGPSAGAVSQPSPPAGATPPATASATIQGVG